MIVQKQIVEGLGMLEVLNAEQTRHVTLLQAIVKILSEAGKPEHCGDDHWGGQYTAALNVCEMISGVGNLYERYTGEPGEAYINFVAELDPKLFSLVKTENEKQKLVYAAAVHTMKWQIERLVKEKI